MEDGELNKLLGIKYQQPLMRWAFAKTNRALRLSREGPPTNGVGKPITGSYNRFTFVSDNYVWEGREKNGNFLLSAKVQKQDRVFSILKPEHYSALSKYIVQNAPELFEGASSWFMVREGFTDTVNGCFRYDKLILCCLVPYNLIPACEALTRSMGRFVEVVPEDLIPSNLISKLPKAPKNVAKIKEYQDKKQNK